MRAPKPEPIAPARGRLFNGRAAAQYLGLTESRLRTLVAAGELVVLRNAKGRLAGVYQSDCDAWVEAHRRVTVAPAPPVTGDARIAHLLPTTRHFQ